jgi:hypothetical protein
MSKFLDCLKQLNESDAGFYYIIGMQNGKKYYITTEDKWALWSDSLKNVKKFTKERAKEYASYSGDFEYKNKPMDEVVLQFKG